MKPTYLLITLLMGAALLFAQAKKATPTPAPAKDPVPTKVSGNPHTTASGVEYWDIKTGNGPLAVKGKTVSVNYIGWFTNGKKFDASEEDEPFDFVLGDGKVIKGWDEGVAGMKVGGKRQLKIPAAAGYGEKGFGKIIPPNSVLIFDVELVGVK